MEKAQICLRNKRIHPLVRSHYLGFVISAFVDDAIEESGTHIEYIALAYVSLELKTSDPTFSGLFLPMIFKSWDQLSFFAGDLQDTKEFVDYNDQLQELYKIICADLEGITVS